MKPAAAILAAVLIVLAFLPARAAEETPVSPSDFRDYAEGWTLYFERDGEPFGSESFDEGGYTRWRYRDGSCVNGVWRAHGAQLCFRYDAENADGEISCWRVLKDEAGMKVRLLTGDEAGLELRVTGRDRRPLLCGAPGQET